MIGRKCKHGNVLSQPVLIGRGLDPFQRADPLRAKSAGRHPTNPDIVLSRLLSDLLPVTMAEGKRLFPFRTEKLSPPAPMVL